MSQLGVVMAPYAVPDHRGVHRLPGEVFLLEITREVRAHVDAGRIVVVERQQPAEIPEPKSVKRAVARDNEEN